MSRIVGVCAIKTTPFPNHGLVLGSCAGATSDALHTTSCNVILLYCRYTTVVGYDQLTACIVTFGQIQSCIHAQLRLILFLKYHRPLYLHIV